MNRLIQVVITTIIISLSSNTFAEVRKSYYESGALHTEWNFKNGKLEGLAKTYYESGTIKSEGVFKNGKLEALVIPPIFNISQN
jgi:antitoxin component YwqK of YwqJK toxin-antitoxin module